MKIVIAKDIKCGVLGYYSIHNHNDIDAADIITTKYIKKDGEEGSSLALCVSNSFDIDENTLRFFQVDKALDKKGIVTGCYKAEYLELD